MSTVLETCYHDTESVNKKLRGNPLNFSHFLDDERIEIWQITKFLSQMCFLWVVLCWICGSLQDVEVVLRETSGGCLCLNWAEWSNVGNLRDWLRLLSFSNFMRWLLFHRYYNLSSKFSFFCHSFHLLFAQLKLMDILITVGRN